MEQIIEYIKQKYNPLTIIIYGSYADGTNDLNSDFDALIISRHHRKVHDTTFVNGIQLDVFVYPSTYFDGNYDCNDFIQISDGKIIADTDGKGKALQAVVLEYIQRRPHKTLEEIQSDIDWCAKMYARVKRGDVEGMFRWHWVLIESLEIFCEAKQQPYLGPKKTLRWMEKNYPTAFTCYGKALRDFSADSLLDWISYLKNMIHLT